MKRYLLLIISVLFLSQSSFGAISRPDLFVPFDNSVNEGVAVQLKVKSVLFATSYEFMLSTSSSFTTFDLYTSDTTVAEVDGLDPGQKYYWKARAKSANDSSSWTFSRNFTVVTKTRLSYPGNNSTNTIGGKAALRVSSYGMGEYIIEFDTSASMNSGYLRTFYFTDTIKYYSVSHIVDSLYFGKDYYWRALAFNDTDTLEWSDTWKFTTLTEPQLKQPNNKQVIETEFTFGFTRDFVMDYYEYEIDTSPNFNSPLLINDTIVPPSAGAFTVSDLKFDTKYWWRVRGFSTLDTTDWAVRECTIDGVKGKFYTDLTVSGNPTVAFRVNRAEFADGLGIEFDTSTEFNSPLKKGLSVPYDASFNPYYFIDTVRNLNYGEVYRMRIRMMASHDTSEWELLSRKLTIRNYAAGYYPFNNRTNVPTDTFLMWDANTLLGDSFRIQLDTSPNFTSPLIDTIRPAIAAATNISPDYLPVKLKFNTVYYWRVKTWHEDDSTLWTPPSKFTTHGKPILTRPFNSTLLRQGATTQFKWEPLKAVDTFQLQVDTSTDYNSSWLIDTTFKITSASELELSQLIFGTHYKWRLRAINNGDTSEWSDNWEFIVWEKPRLNSPKNNAVNTGIFGSFDFNSINGTTGYQIQIDTTADLSNTPIITNIVNNPFFHYQAEDLIFNEQYYWRVKVFHESDTSEWSDQWTFTTRVRNAPNLVSPANNSIDRPLGLDLDWDQFSGVNNYLVQLSLNADMSDSIEYKAFSSKQSVSLRPDTVYYWRVAARNADDFFISDWTEIWQFRTTDSFEKVILTVPANNTVGQPSSFTFRWQGMVGVTGYDFQLSINSDMTNADNRSVTTNQFAYSGLTSNRTYYWRVRAKNAYTKGPWSDVFVFNTNTGGITTLEKPPIRVYPNPSSGVFNIKMEGAEQGEIEIYNSIHQIVYKASITGTELSVDISKQPAGIYFVRYKAGTKSYTLKIIKE